MLFSILFPLISELLRIDQLIWTNKYRPIDIVQ